MKHVFFLSVVLIFLNGCDSYRPEKMPKGSILETGTVLNTSVNRAMSVVPNQSETIYLKINEVFGRKVRDLLIEAEFKTFANEGLAVMKPLKLRVSAGAIPLSGSAYTEKNTKGLSVGCGQQDPSACGVFDIEKGTGVLVKLSKPVDLSGIVITTAEKN
jgi:hypothetical protein